MSNIIERNIKFLKEVYLREDVEYSEFLYFEIYVDELLLYFIWVFNRVFSVNYNPYNIKIKWIESLTLPKLRLRRKSIIWMSSMTFNEKKLFVLFHKYLGNNLVYLFYGWATTLLWDREKRIKGVTTQI